MVQSNTWMWTLAGMGLVLVLLDRQAQKRRWFVLGFLVFSFLAVCPGFYFRTHYFILLLPAASLLAAVALRRLEALEFSIAGIRIQRGLGLGILVLSVIGFVFQHRNYLFAMGPTEVSRMVYGGNPFPESIPIARYIKERTEATDSIAVLGSEPQIYFYAGRRSAAPYVLTYSLMERHPYAVKMQEEMIQAIEGLRPKFLVFAHIPPSWLKRPDSDPRIFEWFGRYSGAEYDRVGLVEILPAGETRYLWDEAQAGYEPRSNFWLEVYERKESRRKTQKGEAGSKPAQEANEASP